MNEIERSYLEHHGVKGMKWGVRRYQNYDGSYTRKGIEHYKKAEKAYDDANSKYKKARESYSSAKKSKNPKSIESSKKKLIEAKLNRKEMKRVLSLKYDQLARDKAADKGKKLYQKGRTISGNEKLLNTIGMINAGLIVAATYFDSVGNTKYRNIAMGSGIAADVVSGAFGIKKHFENKNLRAYYGHSR